jgi:hypothetical protein
VELDPVDGGPELGQGVQLGLGLAPVVVAGPVAGQGLQGGQLHPLGAVGDQLPGGPTGRGDAPPQLLQRLVGNIDLEGAELVGGLGGATHDDLRCWWGAPINTRDPNKASRREAPATSTGRQPPLCHRARHVVGDLVEVLDQRIAAAVGLGGVLGPLGVRHDRAPFAQPARWRPACAPLGARSSPSSGDSGPCRRACWLASRPRARAGQPASPWGAALQDEMAREGAPGPQAGPIVRPPRFRPEWTDEGGPGLSQTSPAFTADQSPPRSSSQGRHGGQEPWAIDTTRRRFDSIICCGLTGPCTAFPGTGPTIRAVSTDPTPQDLRRWSGLNVPGDPGGDEMSPGGSTEVRTDAATSAGDRGRGRRWRVAGGQPDDHPFQPVRERLLPVRRPVGGGRPGRPRPSN